MESSNFNNNPFLVLNFLVFPPVALSYLKLTQKCGKLALQRKKIYEGKIVELLWFYV